MFRTSHKVLSSFVLAGGLFGANASAAIPNQTSSVPERVAAVRSELSKRVLADGQQAVKLPYAQMEVASWLNWVNWNNWNNWRNWNNWANWQNWTNWLNF